MKPATNTNAATGVEAPLEVSTLDPAIDLGDENHLGEAVSDAGLILWPVIDGRGVQAYGPRAEPAAYLTLDKALDTGRAEVLETGNVQELSLVNHSDLPLLLLAGELLDGGHQDRIVARDQVVEPGATRPLASFCVEQGRWGAEAGDVLAGGSFQAGKAIAASSVRAAAQVAKEQGDVWDSAAYATSANSAETSTGTYMALLESEQVQLEIEERAGGLLAALERDDVVGFVVALDWGAEEETVTAEVFGDPGLFAAFRDKLVRAYVLDAVTREKAETSALASGEGWFGQAGGGAGGQQGVNQTSTLGYDGGEGRVMFRRVRVSANVIGGLPRGNDPDIVVTEDQIEAGNVELKHLHRTIYKKKLE